MLTDALRSTFALSVLRGLLFCVLTTPIAFAQSDDTSSIDDLIRDLGSSDAEKAREAAYHLNQLGAKAKKAAPALAKALRSRERQVFFHAVQSIAQIGPDAEVAIPNLLSGLGDGSEQVRYRSAYALGKIGTAAVPKLLDELDTRNSTKRAAVAMAFTWVKPPPKEAVAPLVNLLADDNASVRQRAAEALGGFGKIAAGETGKALEWEDVDARRAAAVALNLMNAFVEKEPTRAAQERLIKALQDEDAIVRATVPSPLARSGLKAKKLVPLLIGLLQDDASAVRLATSRALLRIPPSQTVPGLIDLLDGDNAEAAFASARLVARIGGRAKAAVPALIRAAARIEDTSEDAALSKALGKFGKDAAASLIATLRNPKTDDKSVEGLQAAIAAVGKVAVPGLIESLDDKSSTIRKRATGALARVGPPAAPAREALTKILDDENAKLRANAARALGAIGSESKPSAPALRKLLEDEDRDVRAAAVFALGGIGLEASELIPVFRKTIGDEYLPIRLSATQGLATLGEDANPALPQLIERLDDSDARIRGIAADAIRGIGIAAKPAVPKLLEHLESDEESVRAKVIEALAVFGDASKDAVGPLTEVAAGGESALRPGAIRTLGEIGPAAKASLDAIKKRIEDGTVPERTAAVVALSKIVDDGKSIVDLLVRVLEDKSGDVQRAAVDALADIGPPAQAAVPRLFEILSDEYRREMAKEALERIEPSDVDVLRKALKSRDGYVTVYACRFLAKLGDKAEPAIPDLRQVAAKAKDRRVQRTAKYAIRKIEGRD